MGKILFININNMKFVKLALAALVSSADAMQQKSASELVSQALLMTEAGSDVHQHLTSAIASMGASTVEARSQIVHVPIDEKRDLTLKVSPTYQLDIVNSVTLKSFKRSLVTILSNQLERITDQRARTSQTTTTLPSL